MDEQTKYLIENSNKNFIDLLNSNDELATDLKDYIEKKIQEAGEDQEKKFKALLSDNEMMVDHVLQARFAMEHVALGSLVSVSLIFIFTALKLEEIISWSWVWILAPGWLMIVIVIAITAILQTTNYGAVSKVLLDRGRRLHSLLENPEK